MSDATLPARIAVALTQLDVSPHAASTPGTAEPYLQEPTANDEQLSAEHSPETYDSVQTDRARHDAMTPTYPHERGEIDAPSPPSRTVWLPDRADAISSPGLEPLREPAVDDDEGFFTHFAGIYFIVPVLARLQFAAYLAAHPELVDDGFPMGLLWFIARRAGLPATDPLARAFEQQCSAPADVETHDSVSWQLPARALELLAAPLPRAELSSPEFAWLTAVRRWCRRRARIGLGTLIRRPGRIHQSRTHIEASFSLSNLDLRVRRSALDVDPGWVSWLGRVVRFRYGETDDR